MTREENLKNFVSKSFFFFSGSSNQKKKSAIKVVVSKSFWIEIYWIVAQLDILQQLAFIQGGERETREKKFILFHTSTLTSFFYEIAARAAKGTNPKRQGGRQQKEGRAPRRQFDRHSGTGIV